MLLSVGDGLIVSWYTNVPTTPPLLHPAPPNHFKGRFRISFRINTSKGVSQVFILNDLQKRLSPLESALTPNQGGESKERPTPCPTCATRPPWLGRRCFAAFAPCYVVCLQTNTNCPSCKSFVLITIQIAGGGGVPVPSPFTIQTTPHTCPVLGCEFPPPDPFCATDCSESAFDPTGLRPYPVVYSSSGTALGSGSRNKVSPFKYSVLSIQSKECSCGLSSRTCGFPIGSGASGPGWP